MEAIENSQVRTRLQDKKLQQMQTSTTKQEIPLIPSFQLQKVGLALAGRKRRRDESIEIPLLKRDK
jgi:hypothetical protein